jgi:itaconyl-CoA hydratase
MAAGSVAIARGQVIAHPYSRTVTDLDNLLATLGSLNTAQVHFNVHEAKSLLGGAFTERLVVGSCVLSMVTGLASSGWGSPFLQELGLSDLRFRSPVYAGDTVSAVSEVLDVSAGPDGLSVIRARVTGHNQNGDVVVEVTRTFGMQT